MSDQLSELWVSHSGAKFPQGYGGIDVNGICITSVDSAAAGCISSYMSKESRSLDIERTQILTRCKSDLELALPAIEGEAYEYFSRLHELCHLVLTESEIA